MAQQEGWSQGQPSFLAPLSQGDFRSGRCAVSSLAKALRLPRQGQRVTVDVRGADIAVSGVRPGLESFVLEALQYNPDAGRWQFDRTARVFRTGAQLTLRQ